MISIKKRLITLFTATLIFFLLISAGQIAAAGVPDWERDLPNWDIVVTDTLGLVLTSDPSGHVFPASPEEHGFFEIKNMSPGGKKTSTITIESKCTFPFTLKMEVGCINGVEAGRDDQGNPVDVILAKQLIMRTFINGVELESSPGMPFPTNYTLTAANFLPSNIVPLFPIPPRSDPHVDYKGVLIGAYKFPTITPGSKQEVKIDIELPGDYNQFSGDRSDNKYQNKTARFVWVFTADPGEGGEPDPDPDPKPKDPDPDPKPKDPDPRPKPGDTDIDNPRTPGGNFPSEPNIPEPPDVDIVDPGVPLDPFLPKTGEPPLWYSLLPGLALILSGMALLRRLKAPAPE